MTSLGSIIYVLSLKCLPSPSSDKCAPPPLASPWLDLLASLACIRKYNWVESVPSKLYRPVWFITSVLTRRRHGFSRIARTLSIVVLVFRCIPADMQHGNVILIFAPPVLHMWHSIIANIVRRECERRACSFLVQNLFHVITQRTMRAREQCKVRSTVAPGCSISALYTTLNKTDRR